MQAEILKKIINRSKLLFYLWFDAMEETSHFAWYLKEKQINFENLLSSKCLLQNFLDELNI